MDGDARPGALLRRSAALASMCAALAALAAVAFASPARAADPVLLAAGDIAHCASNGDERTALILDANAGAVVTLGDNAYPDGTASEFARCYAPTWGRAKARTRPSLGNHEYHTPGAAGYFGYFGAAAGEPGKGYYSYDLGSWRLVALNSNCRAAGGCEIDSPQGRWLRSVLASAPGSCTLAYFHHPLFSSGSFSEPLVRPLWTILHSNAADVVLNGHEHFYERFGPQTPDGVADAATGIRQFIVGTGGRSLFSVGVPAANSEARSGAAYGVLKLTLGSASYAWDFLPVDPVFSDAGSAECTSADHAPPETVTTAGPPEAVATTTATLRFTSSEERATFECSLDGSPFTACSSPAAYAGVGDGRHVFSVRAVDAAGNHDATPATWTWLVDTTPTMQTRIVSGPSGPVASRSATFRFAASVPGAAFRCSLDWTPYEPCTASKTYTGLRGGSHTLRVRSIHPEHADVTPAVRRWTVTVFVGTDRRNVIVGTQYADVIRALGGDDVVYGRGGNDRIDPGTGRDEIYGGRGDDVLVARDGRRDVLAGEAGRDRARVDPRLDRVAGVEHRF